MAKTIGIDLGTTNSCVAVMEGGEPTVLENSEGGRTTPSVVAFADSGDRLVGTVAKRQAVMNPENTIFSIKRFMGRKEAEVKEEETIVPYKVVAGPNGDVRIDVRDKQYSPPEISAMILQKTDAEAKLGETVDSAVITVHLLQRRSAGRPGRRQNRQPRVKRIINEPTATRSPTGSTRRRRTTRSSSSTSVAGATSRCSTSATASRSEGDRRRQPPRRRQLGTRRSSVAGRRDKRDQGVDLAADRTAAAPLGGREGRSSSPQPRRRSQPAHHRGRGSAQHLD